MDGVKGLWADDIFVYSGQTEIMERLLWTDALSERQAYQEHLVKPGVAHLFQGDFYGLLRHLNIEVRFWMLSVYLNGMRSPYDYDGKQTTIRIAIDERYRNRTADIESL